MMVQFTLFWMYMTCGGSAFFAIWTPAHTVVLEYDDEQSCERPDGDTDVSDSPVFPCEVCLT